MHFLTVMMWGMVAVIDSHNGHCGYEFPWVPQKLFPFNLPPSYHDFHHTKNKGNYGSAITIWDSLFDTNYEFYEWELEKKQQKK